MSFVPLYLGFGLILNAFVGALLMFAFDVNEHFKTSIEYVNRRYYFGTIMTFMLLEAWPLTIIYVIRYWVKYRDWDEK